MLPALLMVGLFAPTAAPTVGGPRLERGLELVYRGEVIEASDRVTNRFRKTSELEVRVFVLEVKPTYSDCAVMTRIRPQEDAAITAAATAVTGTDPKHNAAAVRLDLIRVNARGRVELLRPPSDPYFVPMVPSCAHPGVGPVLWGYCQLWLASDTKSAAPSLLPLDAPPQIELGPFIPTPVMAGAIPPFVGVAPPPGAVGDTWDVAEPGRPPVVWSMPRETVWNGSRCLELTAVQQTASFDRPDASPPGWRRRDTVLTAPDDGFATSVHRKIEQRDGKDVAAWVEVRYELQPAVRHLDSHYLDVKREVEAAYGYTAEFDRNPKLPQREWQARLRKIDRYLEDNPVPTGFREVVLGARRRYAAAARGDAIVPTVIPVAHVAPSEPPTLGKPAPDFAASIVGGPGQFRPSAVRGKPVVLVFFKPGSSTSLATLQVAEALHKHFGDRTTVAAIAIASGAEQQRKDRNVTALVVDGTAIRSLYDIDSYPRFFIVDAAGTLVWRFDGFGLETGYLIREQLNKLIEDASAKRR